MSEVNWLKISVVTQDPWFIPPFSFFRFFLHIPDTNYIGDQIMDLRK